MDKQIKIGFIGLGQRGYGLLSEVLLKMQDEGVLVTAVCDVYEDRIENAAKLVKERLDIEPFTSKDYRDIIACDNVDAIVIATAWEYHIEIAVAAMEAGKPVATEVGGAYDIADCWRLVNTYEKTGVHCMMLENCCYGEVELMLLKMVREGKLGEIVHCEGGYQHDLRSEIANGRENRHYRLRNYTNRCCDNYPTHELGPIAKLLDINNGNRFISLVSVASGAKGLHEYIVENKGENDPFANTNFVQGDVVTTIIKCANGQTVTIILDTTLPRFYSRHFTVRGTKGAYFEDNNCFYFDKVHHEYEWDGKPIWNNFDQYKEENTHPLWKGYDPKGGHGGMDWHIFMAFIESLKNGTRPPIDTYDTATYMSITPLSERSIAQGSVPVEIPDFTRGKWYMRDDIVDCEYNLDKIEDYKY